MPTSEIPHQWDVVVLPFPYADRLAEKRRPAAVVSLRQMAKEHGIVWVAMITSAANAGWASDIGISDLAAAGLTSPSVIRPAKIATIDVSRIVHVAGHLPESDAEALAHALKTFTGL
jgi:mRNA interferase MazF